MEPFKNNLSPALISHIAHQLEKSLDSFDKDLFENRIITSIHDLELKERIQLIADHLHLVLPNNFQKRAEILTAMMHPNKDYHKDLHSDADGIRGWGMLPLTMVVGQHGLDDFEGSLNLLKTMTSRFSSEFDVRYFLIADQSQALAIMRGWIKNDDPHIRRLVSEGTRPRLPWGMQLRSLVKNPYPTLPLLTALRDDYSEYVRRSVANHLNDIAKDHPDLVANIAMEWMVDADASRKRLLRHACRTLIKQGHPHALQAFGYAPPKLEIKDFILEANTVYFGNSLRFSVTIQSKSTVAQPLIIDYVMHFKKANGKRTTKVFKWKAITLKPAETLSFSKAHPIRFVSTRKYYAGKQAVSLRINGQDFDLVAFRLNMT